ncbi:hypothetical protein F5I97DRAFT_1922575 [Phlebopus sp. FC_14]|nr:hypothetical protein F5I97DRAFT_1922575 [Phlebopus sp. FC_14]
MEWKKLITTLNPNYHMTSSRTFVDHYISKEVVFVCEQQLAELKKHNNLTLIFDSTGTCKLQSLYTVYATTPEHVTHFLNGYEDSTVRHTVDWVKEKLFKTIHVVGADKWAAICSDSTTVTKNSRKEVAAAILIILDLGDVCYHLQNTIKDITKL